MPSCWVVSSIVTVDGTNKPKVATLVDPVAGRQYGHSSAIYPERGKAWALSYVLGQDLSAIDADTDCERVFDEEESGRPSRADDAAFLAQASLTALSKLSRILDDKGADRAGLNAASSRRDWLRRLGMAASGDPDFRPEGWHV